MPTPVSGPNSSYYDQNAQFSPVAGSSSADGAQSPAPVNVPPVVVTGNSGAQQLVKQLDAARKAPDCSVEGKNAALSCLKTGVAAAGGALLATTVVAAGVAVAATFTEAISCGKDLRAYLDCKKQ